MGNAVMCFGWLVSEGRSAGSDDEHSSNALTGRSAAFCVVPPSKLPSLLLTSLPNKRTLEVKDMTVNSNASSEFVRRSNIILFECYASVGFLF